MGIGPSAPEGRQRGNDQVKRSMTVLAIVTMVLTLCGCTLTSTGSASSSVPLTTAGAPTKATAKPKTAQPAKVKGLGEDSGWVLLSATPKHLSGQTWTLNARIVNGSDSASAFLTITYLSSDGVTPDFVFSGAANEVSKGKTVTVSMLSTQAGNGSPKGKPEFQVSAAF